MLIYSLTSPLGHLGWFRTSETHLRLDKLRLRGQTARKTSSFDHNRAKLVGQTDPHTRRQFRHRGRGGSNFASPANATGAHIAIFLARDSSALATWHSRSRSWRRQRRRWRTIPPALRRTLVANP